MVSFFQNIILLTATLYLINSLLCKNSKATCIGKSWNHSKTFADKIGRKKENRIEGKKKLIQRYKILKKIKALKKKLIFFRLFDRQEKKENKIFVKLLCYSLNFTISL